MMASRRKFIALMGGGIVLAAGAGAGGFVATRTPKGALAPWGAAGGHAEPRMRALSYAILAPNPHNRQPWVAELTDADGLTIWRDKARNLPQTDPFDRQLTIGMGCFLELLRMAAAQDGHMLDMDLFPGGEDGPVAQIVFKPGGAPDPLFAHVMDRRTNRKGYEDRPLGSVAADEVGRFGSLISDPEDVAALRALTWDAMAVEMRTKRTHMESVDLMRFGKAEINANPDGISIGGPLLDTLILTGMVTRAGQADPESAEYAQTLDMLKTAMDATPAYAAIVTAGNTRGDQIAAGRDWLRLHLAATGQGLAMQPVSQALQEYPEMAELYAKVHGMLAKPGETVQMLGRIGYGPKVGPAPRWPLETRMRDA
ncbi:MAG: twin-arginine translocation pathway signal protein [Rhodobacter sp.]|nr:twin-arginine translocation pathway signal protein [Rhodobacter sp.]